VEIALGRILKVKIKVGNQCRAGLSHVLDVLNDSGAYPKYEFSITEDGETSTPQNAFSSTRCEIGE
jgi:hypothetical protein